MSKKLWRKRRIEMGLCPNCSDGKLQEGKTMCLDCSERGAKRRGTWRTDKIAKGLCMRCGANKAAQFRGGRCDVCAEKEGAQRKEARENKKAEKLWANL